MAYNKQKVYKQALEAIENKKLIFIEDVIAHIAISKETFYRFYPVESNEYDNIKTKLDKNRIDIKSSLRKRWYEGDNPTTQLVLYKLLSTDTELRKISMQNVDVTGDLKITKVTFID